MHYTVVSIYATMKPILICELAFLLGTRRLTLDFLLFTTVKSPIFWAHADSLKPKREGTLVYMKYYYASMPELFQQSTILSSILFFLLWVCCMKEDETAACYH